MRLSIRLKLFAGFGLTIADLNAWLTLLGGLFTVVYGALKLWDWFEDRRRKRQDWRERDELRASERRTLEGLYRKVSAWPTRPAVLSPEEAHRTRPTPLFDDTYPHDQRHHEGK